MATISPVNGKFDMEQRTMFDWDDTQPTAAQRSSSVSSQTSVKQLFVSEGHRIEVNDTNVNDLFENLNEKDSQIVYLQDLFNKLAKTEFISRLISDVSSDESKLEEKRDMIFSVARGLKEYPYPASAEMKRRQRRLRGETLAFKFASDIYLLVNILDGGSFDIIQNMLSFPKTPSRPDFNSSLCGTQKNASNLDLLSSTVTNIQADLIKAKQNHISFSEKITKEMSSVKSSLTKLKSETNLMFETMKSLIAENTQSIDRISCEKSSGVAKVRSDIKVIQCEMSSNRDEIEQFVRESRETVSSYTKTADKRLGRLEQRLKMLNVDPPAPKCVENPSYVSVGTQVCDIDLGIIKSKCCPHDCTSSLFANAARNIDNSDESLLIVFDNLPEQTLFHNNEADSYADRLMNREPVTRPVCSSAPTLGGQLLYTMSGQNGPRFVRDKDASETSLNTNVKNTVYSQSTEKSPPRDIRNTAADNMHQTLLHPAQQDLLSSMYQNQVHIEQKNVHDSRTQQNRLLGPQQNPPHPVQQNLPHNVWNAGMANTHRALLHTAPHDLSRSMYQSQVHTEQNNVQNRTQENKLLGPQQNSTLPAQQTPPRSATQTVPLNDQPRKTANNQTYADLLSQQQIPTRICRTDDGKSNGQQDIDDFVLHVRKKTKRFYVGQFTPGITEQSIRAFIKGKNGPTVDKINFFNSKNGLDVYLRICVEVDKSDVLTEPDFWPDDVRCRPWYSRNAYMRNVRQPRNAPESWSED